MRPPPSSLFPRSPALPCLLAQVLSGEHGAVFAAEAAGVTWAGNVTAAAAARGVVFEGVSGNVRLDALGDREASSVRINVFNVKRVDAGAPVLPLSGTITLTGAGSANVDLEGVTFHGGAIEPVADGWSCPPGSELTLDRGCVPCPAGHYLNGTTARCAPCGPGTFASSESSMACMACTALPDAPERFQPSPGATTCTRW